MDNRVLQNVAPPQRPQHPFTQQQSIPHQQSTVVVPSQQFRAPIPQHVAGQPMNNALQSRMIEHHETNHSCQQPLPLAQGNSLAYPVPIPLHPAVIIPPLNMKNPENCYQQIQVPQPVSNAPAPSRCSCHRGNKLWLLCRVSPHTEFDKHNRNRATSNGVQLSITCRANAPHAASSLHGTGYSLQSRVLWKHRLYSAAKPNSFSSSEPSIRNILFYPKRSRTTARNSKHE